MEPFELQRMLLGDLPWTFLLEVACRVLAAFLAVGGLSDQVQHPR